MGIVRTVRDSAAHVIVGAVGIVFGLLGGVALVVAAVIPAALGLLAFLASPFRAIIERLRTGHGS